MRQELAMERNDPGVKRPTKWEMDQTPFVYGRWKWNRPKVQFVIKVSKHSSNYRAAPAMALLCTSGPASQGMLGDDAGEPFRVQTIFYCCSCCVKHVFITEHHWSSSNQNILCRSNFSVVTSLLHAKICCEI